MNEKNQQNQQIEQTRTDRLWGISGLVFGVTGMVQSFCSRLGFSLPTGLMRAYAAILVSAGLVYVYTGVKHLKKILRERKMKEETKG